MEDLMSGFEDIELLAERATAGSAWSWQAPRAPAVVIMEITCWDERARPIRALRTLTEDAASNSSDRSDSGRDERGQQRARSSLLSLPHHAVQVDELIATLEDSSRARERARGIKANHRSVATRWHPLASRSPHGRVIEVDCGCQQQRPRRGCAASYHLHSTARRECPIDPVFGLRARARGLGKEREQGSAVQRAPRRADSARTMARSSGVATSRNKVGTNGATISLSANVR